MKEEKTLEVVQETEILGKKIKMYGSIEYPWFLAKDVADWIEHTNVSMMLNVVDNDEKEKKLCDLNNVYITSKARKTQKVWCVTEDGLYECCMHSKKPIAKQMKKKIKSYLRKIRLTGAAIVDESKTADYYFSNFSDDLKEKIFHELYEKNQEYEKQLNVLMETEGLMSMNVVAKECQIGLKRLFTFLRENGIMFYKDNVNVPYQRFMDQKLFSVKECICQDGKTHSATYATKKGLLYIQKQLCKKGYYETVME